MPSTDADIAVSSDSRFLAIAHDLGKLSIWERSCFGSAVPPKPIAVLGGILLGFSGSAFSPDGKRLIGGAHGDEAITIWNTLDYQALLTLGSQGEFFNQIRFSPDGNSMGARSSAGISIWAAPSWEEISATEERGKAQP
jgi:WD40 repeat protein